MLLLLVTKKKITLEREKPLSELGKNLDILRRNFKHLRILLYSGIFHR